MDRFAWLAGYEEVLAAIKGVRDMQPCPYIPGTDAANSWQDGIYAAWGDEYEEARGDALP